MKRFNFSLLFACILALSCPLQGADIQKDAKAASTAETSKQNANAVKEEKEEYDILKRDNIENSDSLAIPYDDSEVEDEEEVNRIEGKDLFHLPHAK